MAELSGDLSKASNAKQKFRGLVSKVIDQMPHQTGDGNGGLKTITRGQKRKIDKSIESWLILLVKAGLIYRPKGTKPLDIAKKLHPKCVIQNGRVKGCSQIHHYQES